MSSEISIKRILILLGILFLLGMIGNVITIYFDHIYYGKYLYVRGKCAWIQSDLRSLGILLEAYYSDYQYYPQMIPLLDFATNKKPLEETGGFEIYTIEPGKPPEISGITTPIAYIPSLFIDVFSPGKEGLPYAYYTKGSGWIVFSAGPDNDYDLVPTRDYDSSTSQPSQRLTVKSYDPTNGTISSGDIFFTKAMKKIDDAKLQRLKQYKESMGKK